MLTDLVARDLLTAALVRLVAPDTSATVLGTQIACRPDGRAIVVRDPEGHVFAHFAVPSFIRDDAETALTTPDEPSIAPASAIDRPLP
ncbi:MULTISPECIES: hypothetical protein [unclassified Variovorax]|uniref:hypothetical protein n=1 Tax=unclassified Variovorax TaxID=663243 RepID=UPI00076C38EA|nr:MULTISPECIES: hypothetical protein [unclassified Variovorax]KWT97722.1 hypothetical protein APY03_1274 [Variovorax sp. WDL1]